jgi:hypothetical protein
MRFKMLGYRDKMPLPHVFLANSKCNMVCNNCGSGFQPRIICSVFEALQALPSTMIENFETNL